jgi:osmotically inducible protein OsmC
MPVDVKYRTTATATGGRDGTAQTQDGSFQVKLSTPKELGGAGGDGANPEQLFAAGYSACFVCAMKAVAPSLKLKVPNDATVTATVGIGPRSEGGFGITTDLAVNLPGLDRQDAQRLIDTAHQVCPYSNATRGNVDVKLSLV